VGGGPSVIDVSDAAFWQDQHAGLAPAREQHPVARLEPFRIWTVLRYAEVRALLSDARLSGFYADPWVIPEGPLRRLTAGLLGSHDPPKHTRLRALLGRAFTSRRIDEQRPFIAELVRALTAPLRDGATIDVQATVADEVPTRVLCRLIGIPEDDIEEFGRWSGNVAAGATSLIGAQEEAIASAEGLYAYVQDLIARRRRQPADDVLDALIAAEAAGDRLSDDELVDILMNLFVAGHETTRSLLTASVMTLIQNPDQLALLRAEPQWLSRAVEEVLRFESPLMLVPRLTRAAMVVGDVALEAGERLTLNLLAANRDPRVFAEPARFDVRRPGEQLALGHGTHFCIGAHLARVEAQALLGALTELPDLELAAAPRWVPFAALSRRVEALPVRLRG
jgi:cytochrome P450